MMLIAGFTQEGIAPECCFYRDLKILEIVSLSTRFLHQNAVLFIFRVWNSPVITIYVRIKIITLLFGFFLTFYLFSPNLCTPRFRFLWKTIILIPYWPIRKIDWFSIRARVTRTRQSHSALPNAPSYKILRLNYVSNLKTVMCLSDPQTETQTQPSTKHPLVLYLKKKSKTDQNSEFLRNQTL